MGKNILKLIILCTLLAGSNRAQWTLQTSPTNSWLWRCVFIDTLNGWASGEGSIIHTSDGGHNWYQQNSNTYRVADLYFVNARIGWAINIDGEYTSHILKTTNGGNNWIENDLDLPVLYLSTTS